MLTRLSAAPVLVLYAMALLGGALLGSQPPVNARLAKLLGDPIWAACGNFVVGSVVLAALALIQSPAPKLSHAAGPWWIWAGGVLAAVYVAMTIIVVPRVGAATLLAISVLGILAASVTIDHFGFLGVAVRHVTVLRAAGAVLVASGAALISRF